MKILLINKFFYPKGGSETVFFQERNFLINNGHKVIDFSTVHKNNLPSEYSEYFIPNVDYDKRRFKPNKASNLFKKFEIAIDFIHNRKAIERLCCLIKRENPDIAHLHNIYHQITPSIISTLKDAGIYVIVTLHDYKLVCPRYLMFRDNRICNECEGSRFWNATINRCQDDSYFRSLLLSLEAYWHLWTESYEKADLVLSPSKFLADLVAKYRPGLKRISILHNGVDIKEHEWSEIDGEYAIYFGRISEEKGVATLLKAQQLTSKSFSLNIVGTGSLQDELKAKYPKVEFLGYKRDEELKKIVNEASFVVVPSEWYENCSMTILEAMACGKPVIGSNVGGIPEQIDNGKTGFLFEMGNTKDLADKIEILIRNKELRKEMGKAARRKVEAEYSLEMHCTKLIEIYEELLAAY